MRRILELPLAQVLVLQVVVQSVHGTFAPVARLLHAAERGGSIGVSSPVETEGLYFRQIRRGNVVFGGGHKGPVDIDTARARVEPQNTLRQMRELSRLAPAFAHVQLIRVWSGIEGYVADSQPVIGASATTPGVYYAFGFNGEGFALGPGVGEAMAELIATGATTTPIEAFSIGRFAQATADARNA